MFGLAPWVRWPPAERSMARKVSPGCSSARNTAWLAWLPEFGCTLAKLAAEEPAGPLDRQVLGDVDELAAAVVAPARIALGVLVGHHRALRLEHGAADDVLRGDQLDLVALAAELVADGAGDLRVAGGEVFGEEAAVGQGVFHGRALQVRGRASDTPIARGGKPGNRRRGLRVATRLEFGTPGGQEWRAPGERPWRSNASISWPARSRSPQAALRAAGRAAWRRLRSRRRT